MFLSCCFNFLESNGLDSMQLNRENEMHYNQSSMNLDATRKYLPFNPEQVNIQIYDDRKCEWVLTVSQPYRYNVCAKHFSRKET